MDSPIRLGLVKGIQEFNAEAFFEAHDTLEEVWMDVRGENRMFFQGLIQLSIGYYHLGCENYPGADHLLTRGLSKLEPNTSSACGVELKSFLGQVKKRIEAVRQQSGNSQSMRSCVIPKIEMVEEGSIDSPA